MNRYHEVIEEKFSDVELAEMSETVPKTINLIIEMSEKARREGLLSLENMLDNNLIAVRDILHFGMRLVVDGTDYDYLKMILENYINTGDQSPVTLLNGKLAMAGCLSIQRGDPTLLLTIILDSLIPRVVRRTIDSSYFTKYYNTSDDKQQDLITAENHYPIVCDDPIDTAQDLHNKEVIIGFSTYDLALILIYKPELFNAFARNMLNKRRIERLLNYKRNIEADTELNANEPPEVVGKMQYEKYLIELKKISNEEFVV